MRNVFEYLVNTGMEQLELIGDAEKKAIICAELAKAVAQSGLLTEELAAVETKKEEKTTKKSTKKNSKKDALKPEASKITEETPQEPVIEETVEEEIVAAPQEQEITDEWTDEMYQLKAEQLELLTAYCEAWGEDYVYGDCLGAFSEGAFTGIENVRPSNIDGFVIYLQELNSQFSQE